MWAPQSAFTILTQGQTLELFSCLLSHLTLIRMTRIIYDSQNYEQIQLKTAWSKIFFILDLFHTKYIRITFFKKVFIYKNAVLDDVSMEKSVIPMFWWYFCVCWPLGVIYDSKTADMSVAGERGALTGSPPCFLLVAWESHMTPRRPIWVWRGRGMARTGSRPCLQLVTWESYMTPSRTAVHFFIANWIRVKRRFLHAWTPELFFLSRFKVLLCCWPQWRLSLLSFSWNALNLLLKSMAGWFPLSRRNQSMTTRQHSKCAFVF